MADRAAGTHMQLCLFASGRAAQLCTREIAKLADLGAEPFANSPAEFAKFIAEFTEKWAKVIRQPVTRLSHQMISR
jgi:hypothetical protein